MAKVKLGNVKGPKGDQGVRGSKWYNTDKITGESTSGTAFPNSGIADAMVGDMALNPTTLNLYTCQTAGNAATAKWVFMACIKGPQGAKGDKGDPTTVDAALSKDSANPIQNKAVATKFQDVQDSLGREFADIDCGDITILDGGFYNLLENKAFKDALQGRKALFTQVTYYSGMNPPGAFGLHERYIVGAPRMKITGLKVRVEFKKGA